MIFLSLNSFCLISIRKNLLRIDVHYATMFRELIVEKPAYTVRFRNSPSEWRILMYDCVLVQLDKIQIRYFISSHTLTDTGHYMDLIHMSHPYIFRIRLCVLTEYDLSKGPYVYSHNFMQLELASIKLVFVAVLKRGKFCKSRL